MRKTVTKTREETIICCDHCGRLVDGGFSDGCWICRAEVCYSCRTLLFMADSDGLIEMPMKICKRCQAGHEELADKIQADLDGFNHRTSEWLKVWRAAVLAEIAKGRDAK